VIRSQVSAEQWVGQASNLEKSAEPDLFTVAPGQPHLPQPAAAVDGAWAGESHIRGVEQLEQENALHQGSAERALLHWRRQLGAERSEAGARSIAPRTPSAFHRTFHRAQFRGGRPNRQVVMKQAATRWPIWRNSFTAPRRCRRWHEIVDQIYAFAGKPGRPAFHSYRGRIPAIGAIRTVGVRRLLSCGLARSRRGPDGDRAAR